LLHFGDRVEIDGGVFANGRVGAAAGFHADDPLGGERLAAHEELHVFPGEDVVGDDGELVGVAHGLAKAVEKGGLARAYRTADADFYGFSHDQDRNSLL
jgi:hypothetical protein